MLSAFKGQQQQYYTIFWGFSLPQGLNCCWHCLLERPHHPGQCSLHVNHSRALGMITPSGMITPMHHPRAAMSHLDSHSQSLSFT